MDEWLTTIRTNSTWKFVPPERATNMKNGWKSHCPEPGSSIIITNTRSELFLAYLLLQGEQQKRWKSENERMRGKITKCIKLLRLNVKGEAAAERRGEKSGVQIKPITSLSAHIRVAGILVCSRHVTFIYSYDDPRFSHFHANASAGSWFPRCRFPLLSASTSFISSGSFYFFSADARINFIQSMSSKLCARARAIHRNVFMIAHARQ